MASIASFLRSLVSGSRSRVVDNAIGVDLDLSYITPNIVATSYPATGAESFWRNSLHELSVFLESRHTEKYLVLNLSERTYPSSSLGSRVVELGFPDHHSPPVEIAWTLCLTMDSWLKHNSHVVVVHCLAGKGRTGVIIACFLLFSGFFFKQKPGPNPAHTFLLNPPSVLAAAALEWFSKKRGEGVKYPSQKRMVGYFARVIHASLLAEDRRLRGCEGGGGGVKEDVPKEDGRRRQQQQGGGDAGAAAAAAAAVPVECLWSAAVSVRSLRSLPLPAPVPLNLTRVVVAGVPGLITLPHIFYLTVTSSPYQNAPTHLFYDSRKDTSVRLWPTSKLATLSSTTPMPHTLAAAAANTSSSSSASSQRALIGTSGSGTATTTTTTTSVSASASAFAAGGTGGGILPHIPGSAALVFHPTACELQGDVLLTFCALTVEGSDGSEVFRTALHTAFVLEECGGRRVYRLQGKDVDQGKRTKAAFPLGPEFFFELNFEEVGEGGGKGSGGQEGEGTLPPILANTSSFSSSSSSFSPTATTTPKLGTVVPSSPRKTNTVAEDFEDD